MVVIKTGYPSLEDDDFRDRLVQRPDYRLFKGLKQPPLSREEFNQLSKEQCEGFEKTMYQHLMAHYLSIRTPYRSLLLYHGLGSGKTCSSITIAEAFLTDHRAGDEPSIIVVSTSTLQKSYEGQIFSLSHKASLEALRDQCTGDKYMRIAGKIKMPVTERERDSLQRDVDANISQRYEFITYNKLASKIMRLDKEGKLDTIRNKVIIIDEAHNLRDTKEDDEQKQKALTQPLIKLLRKGVNNRLVLLSATPMYNEPDEILWLLSLLCLNDKRDHILDPDNLPRLYENGVLLPAMRKKLHTLSSTYISYVRGNNPFTFPVRISPELLNIPVLKTSVTNSDLTDPSWPTYYKDGLVPTPLGEQQFDQIYKMMKQEKDIRMQLKTFEQMNCITYNGKTAREWLTDMFEYTTSPTLTFKYRGSVPWLSPTPDLLGKIASKMQRICDFIKTSTGVIVVYSNYNWCGIVPLALALEHVGFTRYGGSKLIQKIPTSKNHSKALPYRYSDVPNPQYVILSGNQDIMKGGKQISDLLDYVNTPSNKDGKHVKVVLITPVAKEGITIKNTREIHILNPWYNINNLEQAIGRGIRTCSHMLKPLEERNVTVYLHTSTATDPTTGQPMDTSDIHSYRISARKLFQTNEVLRIIRDSAWDCSLMKNLNYIPPSTFDFDIDMKTSQGTLIKYNYGDLPAEEPQCADIAENASASTSDIKNKEKIRPDIYADMIPTIQSRLRKYVLREAKDSRAGIIIPLSNLPDVLRLKDFPEVTTSTVQASLEKDGLLSGYRVFLHKDSIYVVPTEAPIKGQRVSVHIEHEVAEIPIAEQLVVFEYINNIKDDNEAIIFLYENLYADMWPVLAYNIIYTPREQMSSWMKRVSTLLYREGALIKATELPSIKANSTYIGYYDFFKETGQVYLLGSTGKLGEASDTEIALLQSKRRVFAPPTEGQIPTQYVGVYVPFKSKKDKKMKLVFKIFKKDAPLRASNPGIVCTSLMLPELQDMWKSLKLPMNMIPIKKASICGSASSALLEQGRLFLPPVYKPNIKK